MRVLIVKTSSLGDVVHALPALTDAQREIPGLLFDWVVEEAFSPIPSWHSAVIQVIPVALRRWRKAPLSKQTRHQWNEFKHRIQAADYDLVIDAQGLLKSAWLTRMVKSTSHGFDRTSARERLVALSYDKTHHVSKGKHAIERVRELFAKSFDYPLPATPAEYGIYTEDPAIASRQLVFLHGTTWQSKHWPEPYWRELVNLATNDGFQVQLPWGNDEEKARANRLAQNNNLAQLSPAMDLNEIASLLSCSAGAIAVDTGLGHLAAALSLPAVSIYGSTDPSLTGTRGQFQVQLSADFECAPCLRRECTYTKESAVHPACYQSIKPVTVWQQLQQQINQRTKELIND